MRVPLVAVAILALAGACGGGAPSATSTPAAQQTPGSVVSPAGPPSASLISCNDGGVGTDVEIFDFGYQPTPATASAERTVTWTNTGSATHTVTFDTGPDCGSIASAETLSVLFPGPGSYPYHCDIHKSMKGTVAVQ